MSLRRLVAVLLSLVSLGLLHCSGPTGPDPTKVGRSCVPSLESDPAFQGFRVSETTIETGAPECGGGVCLVNHFQGRVTCPLGQPSPAGGEPAVDCQQSNAYPSLNRSKACCLPGATTPVTSPVCGQCLGTGSKSTRDADQAVYCSCRCGVADGQPDEPDYPFCTCPNGFECAEIRPSLGVGDPALTGKFCILQGTAYDEDADQCGKVDGNWSSAIPCAGIATGNCATPISTCHDH